MNSPKANPESVDPVAQEVRFGPPQFVTHLAQSLQPKVALVLHLGRQFVEPLRMGTTRLGPDRGPLFSWALRILVYSQYCEIATIRAPASPCRYSVLRISTISSRAMGRVAIQMPTAAMHAMKTIELA
jgi:hypothetical protein